MRRIRCSLRRVSVGLVCIVLVGLAMNAMGQTPSGSPRGTNVVHGDVLNIEGDTYTIKDKSGHEVAFQVDKHTKQEDRIKVGDKIEAEVTPDGHAETIRVTIP